MTIIRHLLTFSPSLTALNRLRSPSPPRSPRSSASSAARVSPQQESQPASVKPVEVSAAVVAAAVEEEPVEGGEGVPRSEAFSSAGASGASPAKSGFFHKIYMGLVEFCFVPLLEWKESCRVLGASASSGFFGSPRSR